MSSFIQHARDSYNAAPDRKRQYIWGSVRNEWHLWWAHELKRLIDAKDWDGLEKHCELGA